MAKLLLPTKYGGIPYLNDSLISKLSYGFTQFNFGEFANTLDVFDKFHEHKKSKNIIKEFFRIDNPIVGLYNFNKENKEEYGSSDLKSIFITSTNGKYKLENSAYIKYLKILGANYAYAPHENVSTFLMLFSLNL